MNEEICCITDEGTMAKNGWENNDSDFLWALYSVHKIRAILFPYLLVNFQKYYVYVPNPFNKVIKFWKKKKMHRTPLHP